MKIYAWLWALELSRPICRLVQVWWPLFIRFWGFLAHLLHCHIQSYFWKIHRSFVFLPINQSLNQSFKLLCLDDTLHEVEWVRIQYKVNSLLYGGGFVQPDQLHFMQVKLTSWWRKVFKNNSWLVEIQSKSFRIKIWQVQSLTIFETSLLIFDEWRLLYLYLKVMVLIRIIKSLVNLLILLLRQSMVGKGQNQIDSIVTLYLFKILSVVFEVLIHILFCLTFRAEEVIGVFDSKRQGEFIEVLAVDVLIPELVRNYFYGLVFKGLIIHE